MKKFILIAVIIIAGFSKSFGQFKIGCTAGLNLSNLRYNGFDGNTPLLNYNAGFFTQFPLNKQLFIKSSLLYSVKGFNSIYIPQGTVPTRLSYISLPLLVGFNANKRLSFLLGPEINLLLNATTKISGTKITRTDKFEKFDYGLMIGTSFNFNPKFGIDLRYSYGFSKLEKFFYYDMNGNITGFEKSGRNRVLQLSFLYNLKK
jgi:opacity protein-like surface antigen